MKKMYKATAVMGLATFVTLMVGAVKAKFMAVLLGPVGVGIFAQGMTFFLSAETICELGISTGVTKYVSEAWEKRDAAGVRHVMRAAIFLQSLSFAFLFIVILLFSSAISRFVFASPEYGPFLILISGAVLLSSFVITMETTLLGLGRPDMHSKGRIIYNIIGASILIALVYGMKLRGAFLSIPINSVVCMGVVYVFVKFAMKNHKGTRPADADGAVGHKVYFGKLLSYGGVALVSSAITWLTILYIRGLLIRKEGAVSNGLYQVAFGFVSYYMPFFINGVWGYLFPKLSGTTDASRFSMEVNKSLRFILLFLSPAIAVLFLLRKTLVMLIFSKEFLGSLEIIPIYLAGSLFFMLSYIFGTALLAKRRLVPYLAITLSQNILYILLFRGLVDRFGLLAISISYCVTHIAGFLLCASYQISSAMLRINKDNLKLFLLSIGFITAILFIPSETVPFVLFKWALLAIWAVFVVGRREKAMLLSFVRERISP